MEINLPLIGILINIDPKLKIMEKKVSKQFLKIERYVLPREINDKTDNKM